MLRKPGLVRSVLPAQPRLAKAPWNRQTSRSVHALSERTRKDGTSTVAVKLRLMRMGKKKQPTYRVVAADSRSPRDGRFIEMVGVYAPRGRSSSDRDAIVEIDEVKAMRWLSQGAQPTDRVERLLQQTGTWERFRSGLPPVVAAHAGQPSSGPGADGAPAVAVTDDVGSGSAGISEVGGAEDIDGAAGAHGEREATGAGDGDPVGVGVGGAMAGGAVEPEPLGDSGGGGGTGEEP